MKVKMILPALTEATSPFWRPIKYSLFPPLGLATLAGYLDDDDEITLQDEHVETARPGRQPDLVVIQVYITSAHRAYRARRPLPGQGAYVCLGGLHVTALPEEAAPHADTIFLGPGEDTWPAFLADFRAGSPQKRYISIRAHACKACRPIRRDLIKRRALPGAQLARGLARLPAPLRFLLQGGLLQRRQVVLHADGRRRRWPRSTACPAATCTSWTTTCSATRASLPALFDGMRGMGRLWQAAGTVESVLQPACSRKPPPAGLRSLFVGFETLDPDKPAPAAQRSEPRPRLRRGHPPPARPGRDGQRQLRLRHGRRTTKPSSTAPSNGRSSRASRPPPSTS